jgi:arginine N-succinyltransferase
MFVIRQALPDDVPTLLKLARMVHFINLPADQDIIAAKVARSARSFAGERIDESERQYMFVLEDTASGGVIGTSSLI